MTMRTISYRVRNDIAAQVRELLYPRYKESAEYTRAEINAYKTYLNESEKKLQTYAENLKSEFLAAHPDFQRLDYWQDFEDALKVEIKPNSKLDDVRLWEAELNAEVENRTKKIVLELEYGGTKEDLKRMLAEVEKNEKAV